MLDLSEKYRTNELQVIIIDASGSGETTRRTLEEAGISTDVLLDDKDVSREKYGVSATPTTFIVDSAGRIIFKHVGFAPGMEHMLDKEVGLILQRKST